MTPAMTTASSSAIAAATATAIRNSTSRSRRGTVGRRRTGAPTELTQAKDGAGAESPGSSSQPGSEAGRPGPPSRRTSAWRASIRSDSSRTTSVSSVGLRPCAVCSVAVMRPGPRRSSRPSPHVPWRGRARAAPRASRRPRALPAGSGCRAAASLRRSSSAGSAAGSTADLIGRRVGGVECSSGAGAAFRLESMRPSAAMPTIPASQARERFTRAMVSRAAVGAGRKATRGDPSATVYPLPASPRPGHSQLVLAGEAA